MKRIILVVMLAAIASIAVAQKNNVFWSMRINVKMDKKLEWEKKVVAFMKTNYPQFKFRVYNISTGPNSGEYFIALGPLSYADFDKPPVFPKGEAVMRTEEQALDAICNFTQVNHARRVDELSALKADRKLKYTSVAQVEIKIGTWSNVEGFLKKIREARAKGGSKVDTDIFRPSMSGAVNFYTSVQYAGSMAEFEAEEDFEAMYNAVHGKNAWYIDSNAYLENVVSVTRELRVLREDLSSPNPTNLASN